MGSNLFKIKYLPNADGSDSNTALTNANTVFVHTYLGDDSTGDGTREKPYRSMSKALLKIGITYVVFRGVVNEYFSTNITLIGDDKNQMLCLENYFPFCRYIYNSIITGIIGHVTTPINCIIDNVKFSMIHSPVWQFNLSKYFIFYEAAGSINPLYSTTVDFDISATSNNSYASTILNILIVRSCNFYPLTFKYDTFLSTCVFKNEGINIVQPVFTNNSKTNVDILKNALVASGFSINNVNLLLANDSFGKQTNTIICETRYGGNHVPVFNKYDVDLTGTIVGSITANQLKTNIQLNVIDSGLFPTTGNIFIPFVGLYTNNGASVIDGFEVYTYTSITINSPTLITFNGSSYTFKVAHSNGATCTRYGDVLDFTLNPDPTNEALWASDTGGFVGCFRPAESVTIDSGITIIDVNTDGTDTVNAGDLISVDATDNLVFNSGSAQIWNRLRDTSTISIPLGSNFKGLNAMSQDGSPFGNYIGKKQNLIDTTVLNPGDALTVGTWYKIFNDVSKDVTKAIIYNGVQYLPSYTFLCITAVTVFSLLNSGSGSYVKKINVDVLESIEMLPYDDATTPSAFPKFSAPLMGECKLLYYTSAGATRYGKTAGNPVLFGDLAGTNFATDFPGCNDKIAYYDGYAISNADQEFFTLANPSLTSPKSTYFTTSIPILRFLRREINAHFDADYSY